MSKTTSKGVTQNVTHWMLARRANNNVGGTSQPPLHLEWDRLGLSGAVAQQSHDRDGKPQQQADRHEGERY